MSGRDSHRYNRKPYFVTKTKRIVLLCRWHPEKTASMWIWPDGGYHCFGCQRTGRVQDEDELQKIFDEVHDPTKGQPDPRQTIIEFAR